NVSQSAWNPVVDHLNPKKLSCQEPRGRIDLGKRGSRRAEISFQCEKQPWRNRCICDRTQPRAVLELFDRGSRRGEVESRHISVAVVEIVWRVCPLPPKLGLKSGQRHRQVSNPPTADGHRPTRRVFRESRQCGEKRSSHKA